MTELDQLAAHYGTDKGVVPYKGLAPKGYTRTYAKLFKGFRNEQIVMVELGIQDGGSLKMWREYFPNARIIGIDIQERCLEIAQNNPGIEVYIGDCTDKKFLKRVLGDLEFDIVIDDASHDTYEIIKSYEFFRWQTKRFYCIEDLHAATGVPRWLADSDIPHKIEGRMAIIPC